MSSPSLKIEDILNRSGLCTLDENPDMDTVEACLQKLKEACVMEAEERKPLLRERAVSALKNAKIYGAREIVTGFLAPEKTEITNTERQGSSLNLEDPEPWPNVVSGPGILDELVDTFQRFVVLPKGAAPALALWTLHTHAFEASDVFPILNVTSPTKRCGKTTLLHVLDALVYRPLSASNITTAAIFRTIEKYRPTLLIDEADSFLGHREELRGILNSGHTRRAGHVVRIAGDDHEPRKFSTWGPKALFGINRRGETLEDRSIPIQLRRKTAHESVESLRLDRPDELVPLQRKAWTWAQNNLDALRAADPDVPELASDRAADNWRPLLAIADRIGGGWRERALRSATLLSGSTDEEDDGFSFLLLEDIRRLFRERRTERLASAEIVKGLLEREDRPWAEWRYGCNGLTQNALSRLLKPFGIRPRKYRFGDRTFNGYALANLQDSFARYIPQDEVEQPEQSNNGKHQQQPKKPEQQPRCSTSRIRQNTASRIECSGCSGCTICRPLIGAKNN